MLCFITASPGNECSRETTESDHRSSTPHKLCAPPAPSLLGSPLFPAVRAVWGWGRSVHQAEGGPLGPLHLDAGVSKAPGASGRMLAPPPQWGRSSRRHDDVAWGRERLGQGRSVLRGPHSDPRGRGEAVSRKGLKLQPEHRKEHAPRGGTRPGRQLQATPCATRIRPNKPGGGGLPVHATRTHQCGAGACRGPDRGGTSSGWRRLPLRAGI